MHLDAFIKFVEDDWTVTASYYCLSVLVSPNAAHLWMNGTDIAHLSAPERANLLYVEVLMTFAKLVRL